jgi:hypothetical protein
MADQGAPAGWLSLAASPTFALMAAVAANDYASGVFCSLNRSPFPVNGMAAMYLLMSFFHLSPWLKLAAGRRAPD